MNTIARVIWVVFMIFLYPAKTIALPLSADNHSLFTDIFQEFDSSYSVATRLYQFNNSQPTGVYLNENTFIAYHNLQAFVLAWRIDNQTYHPQHTTNLNSDTEFQLSELSWSHSFLQNEQDLWQIGKFNFAFDPSYAFQNTGFFAAQVNPFDDFASTEGIPIIASSLWLGDYYLSSVFSNKGQTTAAKDLWQWGLMLQKDFTALSTGIIIQQYQHSNLGGGGIFTYVIGDGLEFHGSAFIRKGGIWLKQISPNKTVADEFTDKDSLWLPSITLGTVWSSEKQQVLFEWNYQREKFSSSDIDTLNKISRHPYACNINDLKAQQSIINLHQQRYQQQYLFAQYQYILSDHIFTANSLIGKDNSALSQAKYEYLHNTNLLYWIAFEFTTGAKQTEFQQIPWQSRLQIGLQWKI